MGTAFLYGNGGSGGTGATLTVTAPAGCTVTVSKDGKSKTKVADSSGTAVFKGLSSGEWTITITDGTQTAQKTVTITADYSTSITFFSATIHVRYPAGSTCTATDGVTTLTAPDTSGTWDCVVPNAGTWTVSLDSGFSETVTITDNGEEQTIDKWHLLKDGYGAVVPFSVLHVQQNAIVSITENGIVYTYSAHEWSVSTVFTDNKIDLTGFKTLNVEAVITGTGQPGSFCGFVVSDAQGSPYSASARFSISSTKKVFSCSIESLSGQYYIGIEGGIYGTIYRIWLE